MKPAERDILHGLLSAVVDRTIDEQQAADLARLLKTDADARRFYVRYLDMHAALTDVARWPESTMRRRMPWVAIIATLVAASLLLALLAAPLGRSAGEPAPRGAETLAVDTALSSGYVATIAAASGDAVLNGDPAIAGTRLIPGVYEVSVGTLTIRFDGGARVLFEGSPRFTLRSRRAVAIERGTFVFEGDRLCESIEIVTPHSVFRNIGTRYAAVIDAHAEEVHVAEGSVRRTTADRSLPMRHELIQAGVGRRYGGQDVVEETIPLDETLVARPLVGVALAAARNTLTVNDDFRTDREAVKGTQTGFGWAEPWRSARGDLRLVSPGLAGEGSVAVLHDGVGDDPARSRSAAHRTFVAPIDLSVDGVRYLRFLVRRGPCPLKDDHRAMVVLRKRGLTPEEEVEQSALIQIALRRDDMVMVRLADTITRASLPQVPGQTYAVVAKIVSGRTKPEQVLVRLMAADRLVGSEEPAEWSVVSESVHTDLLLDQLSLECVSAGRIEFDGLRIGPTWESVTGAPADR
jgi:hypothetical protein